MDPTHVPGVDGQPSQAHSSKPDPDEPWRYVCPECGGQPSNKNRGADFTCTACQRKWSKDELEDLKSR